VQKTGVLKAHAARGQLRTSQPLADQARYVKRGFARFFLDFSNLYLPIETGFPSSFVSYGTLWPLIIAICLLRVNDPVSFAVCCGL